MHINVKATNTTLTPAISDYIEKRLNSLEHFIDADPGSVMCDVEVGKTTRHHHSGDVFRAEFNLNIAGKYFRAVAEEGTLYSAIDVAHAELQSELQRNKRKGHDLMKRGGAVLKALMRGVELGSERITRLTSKWRRKL